MSLSGSMQAAFNKAAFTEAAPGEAAPAPSATAADIMRYLAPIIGGPDSAGAWKIFVDTLRAHPHAALGDAQAACLTPVYEALEQAEQDIPATDPPARAAGLNA